MNDRFVIHNLHAEYPRDVVAELPTGTWRVTVHDDGTVEVVGLRTAPSVSTCVQHGGIYTAFTRGEALMDGPCSQSMRGDPPCEWRGGWVDVPAVPERSPQVSDVSASEPRDGAR